MKKKYGLKAILASALVSFALAAPAVVFSAPTAEVVAEIHIEGAELRQVVSPSGEVTVQATFDVSLDHVANAAGASFFLKYNPDYLTPSDATTNEPVISYSSGEYHDEFFASDPELYYTVKNGVKTVVSPFSKRANDMSYVTTQNSTIHMALWLAQDSYNSEGVITATGGASGTKLTDGEIGGKVEKLEGIGNDDTFRYVMNLRDVAEDEYAIEDDPPGRVTLGSISFQVNQDHLAEMIDYFGGLDVSRDRVLVSAGTADRPWVTTKSVDGTPGTEIFLLDIPENRKDDPWTVENYEFYGKGYNVNNLAPATHANPDDPLYENTTMVDSYTFNFDPKAIVDVQATEPEVTVNAYQNFTKGDKDDLPLTMGRYSPTVTVTYADGSKENVPFPWGQKNSAGAYKDSYKVDQATYYTQADVDAWTAANPTGTCPFAVGDQKGTEAVTNGNYDPTHGVYTFSQLYRWTDGAGQTRVYPKPVTAKLTVTPITVISVNAEDMERSYNVTDVVDQVTAATDLRLPGEARIQTDIVPAGVSLSVPIKGWKPVQPASATDPGTGTTTIVSTWPGVDPAYPAGKQMNSLKADDYVMPAADPGTGATTGGYPYWPDSADKQATLDDPGRFLGRYTFETSQGDHATKENILSADIQALYPWLTIPFKPGSTTDRVEDWDVGQAHRSILGKEDYDKVDPGRYEVKWVSTVTETAGNNKQTPDGRMNGVGQPTLRLSVAKKNGTAYGSMSADSVFRVWLPNGQELGTGQVAGGVSVDSWFTNSADTTATAKDHVNGYYDGSETGSNSGGLFFYLITNPDQPEVNEHGTQRETLRRYINLGGWYEVAICEDPGSGDHWTEPIPVYVPPRRNEYIEDKVYNFLGANAALCNWPGGVGDTLYLPRGEYDVVGPLDTPETTGVGLPLYLTPAGPTDGQSGGVFEAGNLHRVLPGVERYRESYGVKTIYDGQTGAQPGEIFNVRVKDETSWHGPNGAGDGSTHATVGGNPVYKYGPTPLYEGVDQDGDGVLDGYAVAGFGRVFQPEAPEPEHTATLRREGEVKDAESVRIKLLSWDTDGITRAQPGTDYDNDNVTLVTYDTKQEGYTVRQDFTLTIKNVGTTDIYGLDIDTVLDGYDLKDDGDQGKRMMGGHFEMLKPPANFLPVGGTTTFTLTYVYNLASNTAPNALLYRDTLYITANGHDDPGKGKQHDTGLMSDQYLLDFDAEFVVSKSPLYKVNVIYKPENGNMGTANLIVGEQGTSAADAVMIYTPTTRTYAEDNLVYVVVNKVDEYAVKSITANIGTNGATVNVKATNAYQAGLFPGVADFFGTAAIDPMKEVYVFQMPDHDVTVTVNFYEPFHSKLRLENLIDFSSPKDPTEPGAPKVNDLKTALGAPDPCDDHTYKIWRKTFTDAERDAATSWEGVTHAGETDYYLMTQGKAMPHGANWPADLTAADEGQQFISGENQYIVVIDAEDDLSQVEAKIRRIVYHEDYEGVNENNYPNGRNYEIELNISMDVYPYNVEDHWGDSAYQAERVYDPSTTSPLGYGQNPAFTGNPRRANISSNVDTIVDGGLGLGYTYPPEDPSSPTATSDSSLHTSVQFDSPARGESSYVVISLSAYNPELGRTDTRRYYLEIHRKTDEPDVDLHYGNSPYGMIMNEDRFDTAAKQEAAKAAFRDAGYTFEGLKKAVVPDAVWEHTDMQHVIYWREAWVRNGAVFEPESLTGFEPARHSDGTQKFYDEDPDDHTKGDRTKPIYVPDKKVYSDGDNLDLNDYAYFAILGEKLREPGVIRAWDSSGRPVDINTITAVAMDVDWEQNGLGLTLLDAEQTKQVDRFKGNQTDHPILDLGIQGSTFEFLAEHQLPATFPSLPVTDKNWPASSQEVTETPEGGGDPVTVTKYSLIEDIRPGRYAIVYSFTDFDGTTTLQVDRPFVILRGVGDVNTDGKRDNGRTDTDSDEYHIEDRVGNDPLGYEAGLAPTATEPYGAGYPFANIFKFRVCDVNNDRNVNHIDANQLDKNVRQDSGWLRFYHPYEYGL